MNKYLPINYSFDDETNYKYELAYSSKEIFNIYVEIISSYIKEYIAKDAIYMKHPQFYYYLLNKGVDTLGHIFKILLFYTKNLEFSEYYCRKSINYYIEFLNENTAHDENKIDYNHASLFSYRNTIYNLNKKYRKTHMGVLEETKTYLLYDIETTEEKIYKNVEYLIALYQKILETTLVVYNKDLFCSTEKDTLYEYIKWNIDTFVDCILALNREKIEINRIVEQHYNYKLEFIIDFIQTTNIQSVSLFYTLINHVRERRLSILNKAILIKKLLHVDNKIKKETPASEYIQWLLN